MDQSPNRRLSEISHLFLSDVRNVQTGHSPRPHRKPPGSFKGDVSVDLTPEEFAQVFGETPADSADTSVETYTGDDIVPMPVVASAIPTFKPVRAIIAHHLGELMADRVRDLATMFAPAGSRVGVIYADGTDIRVGCFEHGGRGEDEVAIEPMEPRRIEQTLIELNTDVSQWFVVLPEPRSAEARELLKLIGHWVLISAVDHDGVVSSYRTIKGLCDVAQPNLEVAVFGAVDEAEVQKTHRKLAGVCEQFLHVKVGLLGALEPAGDDVAEHCVLHASTSRNNTQPLHWAMLAQLAESAAEGKADRTETTVASTVKSPDSFTIASSIASSKTPPPAAAKTVSTARPNTVARPAQPRPASPVAAAATPAPVAILHDTTCEQVIDLPNADASAEAILRAVIAGGNDYVQTPIKSPPSADVVVAVSRDHQLTLLAVVKSGLSDLHAIGLAYRWMNENRALIAMAVPQFSLDSLAMPRLELFVDHADITAAALQPLLESGHITVRAYRKLRWGGKTGLLLEAA